MDEQFYTGHLAQVNKVSPVIATQDIQNEQGQLLLPAGDAIDEKASERILRFKLLKPLEDSIAIENQFTGESLNEAIQKYFSSSPSLYQLWETNNEAALILSCCDSLCSSPILAQKLTVLAHRYPHIFEQGLFCAWLGALIFSDEGNHESAAEEAFIAGIFHDVGLLHLNPNFMDIEYRLNPEEWRQMQTHPLISSQIIKGIGSLSNAVIKGIEDHHECIDATGYPAGKITRQISAIGLILHLLDSIHAIYIKNFKPLKRSIADLQPLIQMNLHYRHSKYANALLVRIRSIPATTNCSTPEHLIPLLLDNVIDKNNYILKFIDISQRIGKELGYQHGEKKLLGLQNILLHIHISLNQAGLVNQAYMRWLKQVKEERLTHAYREVEDVSLMLTEVIFHISRFQLKLSMMLKNREDAKQITVLSEVNASLMALAEPKVDPVLEEFHGKNIAALDSNDIAEPLSQEQN